jgi:flagellar hook assembly protein FlgD
VSVDHEGPAPDLSLARASPNPFSGSTAIRFALETAGPVSVVIYGPDGRQVATLASGSFGAGTHGLRWNGRGNDGAALAPGRYFCRLRTRGTDRALSLTLLR